MTTILTLAIVLAMPGTRDDERIDDAHSLLEKIEALQQPVNDFQCEFEGTVRFEGKNAETSPVDADGLYETFSGTYIWQRGGDIRCDSLHRLAVNGQISRQTLVMRARDTRAYCRMSLGHPREVPNISAPTSLQAARRGLSELFPLGSIKAMAADANYELSVSDGQREGNPSQVLGVAFKDVRDSLMSEYDIDLKRNGHVVRIHHYMKAKTLSGWFNIQLDSFSVDGVLVWMPVSGESVGLTALENGRRILTNGPTSIRKFRVVRPTMEFNKHPGPDVFSTSYSARPPVSEGLRKLEHEFALQVEGFRSESGDSQQLKEAAPGSRKGVQHHTVGRKDSDRSTTFRQAAWSISALTAIILMTWLAVRMRARAS
jgi:hypothetical protein